MKIKIFYSWQSTTETKYNKNFILSCIQKSVKKVKLKPEFKDLEFEILEGITGESGSPQVASKIVDERIPNSDIFISDLSVVNHISGSQKAALKDIGIEFKPFQNNNVLYEYGVAYNAIGLETMIGVLNTAYGSPNENPDNIPFDLKHIRYPIEYDYSENTKNKEEVQNNFISTLSSAIKEATITALQSQKSRFRPLQVWSDWETNILATQQFISNEKTDEIKALVLEALTRPNQTMRILGLSGLGKTRILLEIFRPIKSDEDSILLSSRVLYLNCNLHPNAEYQTIVANAVSAQTDPIIILDNCPPETHRQLHHFIQREGNKACLISIDSNPEEIESDKINNVNYISIRKEELSSVVDELLASRFNHLDDESKRKIKDFSQGIPLMAVLLGESVDNGEEFIGKLDDKDLLNKLLGAKGKDEKHRTILKSCSIFNYFGIYDELATQMEFIAKSTNITSLNGDDNVKVNDFNETCDYYLKREIFEKKGRFIGMRPFPLAMSLAQEWLAPLTPTRLINVISEIAALPDPDRRDLSKAFAEQMKYLGYNDKAVQIVEKIIGPDSPFDDAEVLNTDLGSRLFRSFVEVNPIAVAQNFTRQFLNKSTDDLLGIVEGRRNIIWTLEKLCFDKRTFADGAKVLLQFAIAENETWGNNATAQFLHLFNTHLAGTEADLNERWKIIEWALGKEDNQYTEFAIKAMKVGLNFGHASRMGGAEQQGSRRLVDNNPTWKEIEDYWTKILDKLLTIIKSKSDFSDFSSTVVSNSIRMMFHTRRGGLMLPFLREIANVKSNDWDGGLIGLKYARKYEKNLMPEGQLEEVNRLIESLTKTDFITRYLSLSDSQHLDNDERFSSEKAIAAIIVLADEFVSNQVSWEESFPTLFKNQQFYSYHFGKRLAELLKDDKVKVNEFVDYALEVISQIPIQERNYTVLGGFVSNSDEEVKRAFYDRLYRSKEFRSLLFYFLSVDDSGKEYFNLLFQLIEDEICDISNFYTFNYSNSLRELSLEELEELSKKLFSFGDEGYAVVFDLFFDLGYGDEPKKNTLLPIIRACILKLGVSRAFRNQYNDYKWSEALSQIISDEKEVEFARFTNKSVIDSITWENSYHLDFSIQRTYEILMKVHFNSIWKDLSAALLSSEEDYIKFYGLKHILGSHIGGVGRSVGVLFEGDIEAIFNWCEENRHLAPSRLAELTPIFDNNNTDYAKWHPVALRLINEFGDIEEVLSHLSSNMGTFSWVGSVVPFLESKKELFKQLLNHRIERVREWANSYITYLDRDIERETNRDAEHFR